MFSVENRSPLGVKTFLYFFALRRYPAHNPAPEGLCLPTYGPLTKEVADLCLKMLLNSTHCHSEATFYVAHCGYGLQKFLCLRIAVTYFKNVGVADLRFQIKAFENISADSW